MMYNEENYKDVEHVYFDGMAVRYKTMVLSEDQAYRSLGASVVLGCTLTRYRVLSHGWRRVVVTVSRGVHIMQVYDFADYDLASSVDTVIGT